MFTKPLFLLFKINSFFFYPKGGPPQNNGGYLQQQQQQQQQPANVRGAPQQRGYPPYGGPSGGM